MNIYIPYIHVHLIFGKHTCTWLNMLINNEYFFSPELYTCRQWWHKNYGKPQNWSRPFTYLCTNNWKNQYSDTTLAFPSQCIHICGQWTQHIMNIQSKSYVRVKRNHPTPKTWDYNNLFHSHIDLHVILFSIPVFHSKSMYLHIYIFVFFETVVKKKKKKIKNRIKHSPSQYLWNWFSSRNLSYNLSENLSWMLQ